MVDSQFRNDLVHDSQMGPSWAQLGPNLAQLGPIWNAAWMDPSKYRGWSNKTEGRSNQKTWELFTTLKEVVTPRGQEKAMK